LRTSRVVELHRVFAMYDTRLRDFTNVYRRDVFWVLSQIDADLNPPPRATGCYNTCQKIEGASWALDSFQAPTYIPVRRTTLYRDLSFEGLESSSASKARRISGVNISHDHKLCKMKRDCCRSIRVALVSHLKYQEILITTIRISSQRVQLLEHAEQHQHLGRFLTGFGIDSV